MSVFFATLFLLAEMIILPQEVFAQEESAIQTALPTSGAPNVIASPSAPASADQVKAAPLLPLERYKAAYFISGKPDTKVQFSFKYKILKRLKLYFGYTQVMYWDLFGESSPFEDITYNPELFYDWEIQWGILKTISFGLFEHDSNGKAGLASRSHNSSYLQLNTEQDYGNWEFKLDTKVSYFYGIGENNRDIANYMGFWQIQGSVLKTFSAYLNYVEVYGRIFPGGRNSLDFTKGGQEFGLKVRFNLPRFGMHLFVQGYHGYLGSLLNYSEEEKALRVGILL